MMQISSVSSQRRQVILFENGGFLPVTDAQRAVLLVDDDVRLAEMLALHLREHSCRVVIAHTANEGVKHALSEPFDLIVLDRGLPDFDGLEACKQIREKNSAVPILMLTALSEEYELVAGFSGGADDYVPKPFKLAELMARIEALLRRGKLTARGAAAGSSNSRNLGELSIDLEQRKVTVAGRQVDLTAKEFNLLAFLSESPGRVWSRDQILEMVWGYSLDSYDGSLTTMIKRLRNKLGDEAGGGYIETVRGVGYRFIVPSK